MNDGLRSIALFVAAVIALAALLSMVAGRARCPSCGRADTIRVVQSGLTIGPFSMNATCECDANAGGCGWTGW